MKETLRLTCFSIGKKLHNDTLISRFSPYYYVYAQRHIQCQCPTCKCPSQEALAYSFVYIDEAQRLMYFAIPKCASSTIRQSFLATSCQVVYEV